MGRADPDRRILVALEKRRGAFVPWDELARLTGLDRPALRTRVDALQGRGYWIEERAGSGVRLLGEPEALSVDQIRGVVPPGFVSEVRVFGDVGSTNDLARRLALEIPGQNGLVIAESQSKGRGRCERRWFSPAGVGLWFSLVLWPRLEPPRTPTVGLLASIAVASAIRRHLGLDADVKWPNDVLIRGRKVSGILPELAEVGGRTCAVLGVGANVNQREEDFPADLQGAACSIRMHAGSVVDRVPLLGAILDELAGRYGQFQTEGFAPFRAEWESLSTMPGRRVRFFEGRERIEGTVLGVADTGALKVCVGRAAEHHVIAGDVELLD